MTADEETEGNGDQKLSVTSLQSATYKIHNHLVTLKVEDDEPAAGGKLRGDGKKKVNVTFMEKVREVCTQLDMFASAHVWPIHILCIVVATVIIPISAVSIVWDLLSAIVFQIPDLSTINTPAFVLFINFIAMPLAMYGYMMEYLLHEHSKLAIIALLCVVIHPILFTIRALIEFFLGGYRGEEKIYYESFQREGQEQKYPIGVIRYRAGEPFSDSADEQAEIRAAFGK